MLTKNFSLQQNPIWIRNIQSPFFSGKFIYCRSCSTLKILKTLFVLTITIYSNKEYINIYEMLNGHVITIS